MNPRMEQEIPPVVMSREFFIRRAIDGLNYYDKIKQLRGEEDPLCEEILKTANLNKTIADFFK